MEGPEQVLEASLSLRCPGCAQHAWGRRPIELSFEKTVQESPAGLVKLEDADANPKFQDFDAAETKFKFLQAKCPLAASSSGKDVQPFSMISDAEIKTRFDSEPLRQQHL